MSTQQISDGEEETDQCEIDDLISSENGADIRKNLFNEFDVPAKQKTSAESSSSGREYMKVYLRVRPFSTDEIEGNEDQQCLEKESHSAVLMNAPKESFAFKNSSRAGGDISHRFSFSNVFDETTSQKKFFDETTLPLVADFIHGQNCLVFTYGVTNSGKTYTIQGTPKDGGILPRTLDVLFNSIEGKHYSKMNLKPRFCTDVIRLTDEEEHRENNYKSALLSSLDKDTFDINALLKLDQDLSAEVSKVSCDESALHNTIKSQDGDHEQELPSVDAEENVSRVVDDTTIDVEAQGPVKFAVWVSFAEIYNETIYDLLEPCPMGKGKKRTTLRLGDDSNGNPYIKGLREIYVANADEACKILKIGQKNQRIASTKLNQNSSRSHCIFSVKVLRVVDVDDPHVARVSRLSFVDLAGSERYSKTQSKGDRLKEAGNINTSLMTLGKCLEYLRYNQRNPSQPLIIPFRESKLTRLFQGFFCGKGRASMIVNVNMCASMFDETLHVMKFSAIAKKVTTRVTKPIDIPPPAKKQRTLAPNPRSKANRLSIPWVNGAVSTPAPLGDETLLEEEDEDEEVETVPVEGRDEASVYGQQLVDLVKVLQEKLIDEKRKMQSLEVKIREEVCKEMAEQLVSIENAYSERVKMEVTAVEEKCDRRIELLTQSIKKNRKRARIERIEEDDEEWVPSVFLHAEQTKVKEKQHIINDLNAKIAELRQEVKQLKESKTKEMANSEAVLELQAHLNSANEEVNDLKQMLEEAGEAFTEKEAEINKLRAALDEHETCFRNQDEALKHLTKELELVKSTAKQMKDPEELGQLKGALELASMKLAETEKNLETKDSMMKELVRTLEETREELARERSYVAQAFDNDEELIKIKDELQNAEQKMSELEKNLTSKDEAISCLKQVVEDAKTENVKGTSQAEENHRAFMEKESELKKANEEVAALARQLKEANQEVCDAKEELEKLRSDYNEKDFQLDVMKKERDEKTAELQRATREISDKVAVLEGLKKQIADVEADLVSVKEDNLKKASELEKALEEKVEILARMEKEVHQTRDAESSDCRTEVKKLKNEDILKELEQQLEESTKALDKKNSQVIARNNTIKRLELSLAEKEKQLSENEKLPKEPNLRAKEELKTLRRRLVQADKEREESKDLLANKDSKLEEARKQLEKLRSENDEMSAKFMKDTQNARTELNEVKEEAQKNREEFRSLKEEMHSQRLKNACLQTQLENAGKEILEKEKGVQAAKEELKDARGKSSTELHEARQKLASAEQKLLELEREVETANETSFRFQAEVEKLRNEIVPGLEKKVKGLEEENSASIERVREFEEKLEQKLTESRSQLEKRNQEIEQREKEVTELKEMLKTAEQNNFQELDKEMMSMQKTIQERNKSVDELEQKLRDASLEQQKSKENSQTLKNQLESLRELKVSLEEKLEAMKKDMEIVTTDTGKDKDALCNMKRVLEEQDLVMTNQAQEIDERQNEIETLSTELQTWQERCSFAEKELDRRKTEIANFKQQTSAANEENKRWDRMTEEINKLKEDRSSLETQLNRKDEEVRKANDSRDNIMKTMREALDVAKANKAEYEIKLATVREQCRQEMQREMEEQMRRAKRDFQRQLEEKDKSLEEIKIEKERVVKTLAADSNSECSTSEPDSEVTASGLKTSAPTSSQKKQLKRSSSDLTLAELKNQLSATKKGKTGDSDDDFTPGKPRTRMSTKKGGRSGASRSKRAAAGTADILPTMESKTDSVAEKKTLFKHLQENVAGEVSEKDSVQSNEETENIPPNTSQSTTKKRRLFRKPSAVAATLSPAKTGSREESDKDKVRDIISRQLRPRSIRSIKYN